VKEAGVSANPYNLLLSHASFTRFFHPLLSPLYLTRVPPPRILLVRFSSLGDVLLLTPLIRALRARHPAATLTALTKQEWAPLLSANPQLDQVATITRGQSLVPLARALRQVGYTHRLDLHASVRSRMLRLLVPGTWHSFNARRSEREALIRRKEQRYQDQVPVAERYFEAAASLDVAPDGRPCELFISPAAEARAEEWLARHDVGSELIACAPGAAHATKRWPIEHWHQLIARLTARGLVPIILGGEAEREAGRELVQRSEGRTANAAGELDLQATAALLRRARVAISGDTGAMHMATAVDTPVVALFGPTVEAFGFFPYRAAADVVQRELDCRPCSSKGSPRCPLGHHRCMQEILPDEVMDRVERLLP
jgi:lipopolysaccharide heptosyltransferase II